MAHAVETMMYAGVAPWHGLGKRVAAEVTSDEAIKLAGLDWKVELAEVQAVAPGGRLPAKVEGSRAVVRQTDGRPRHSAHAAVPGEHRRTTRRGPSMRCENVDLERQVFRIWRYKSKVVAGERVEGWRAKNGKSREVPIADVCLPWLTPQRLADEWLFPSPATGKRYRYWPQRIWERARDAAGLQGGVHRIRHSYASSFLANSPDFYLLAQVLGHTYAEVTELYSHLSSEHLARARNVVSLSAPAPSAFHTTTIRRDELYEKVWTAPGSALARAFGISDVALGKICLKLNVPRPGRGYWAKTRNGQAPKRTPLPPLGDGPDKHVVRRPVTAN